VISSDLTRIRWTDIDQNLGKLEIFLFQTDLNILTNFLYNFPRQNPHKYPTTFSNPISDFASLTKKYFLNSNLCLAIPNINFLKPQLQKKSENKPDMLGNKKIHDLLKEK